MSDEQIYIVRSVQEVVSEARGEESAIISALRHGGTYEIKETVTAACLEQSGTFHFRFTTDHNLRIRCWDWNESDEEKDGYIQFSLDSAKNPQASINAYGDSYLRALVHAYDLWTDWLEHHADIKTDWDRRRSPVEGIFHCPCGAYFRKSEGYVPCPGCGATYLAFHRAYYDGERACGPLVPWAVNLYNVDIVVAETDPYTSVTSMSCPYCGRAPLLASVDKTAKYPYWCEKCRREMNIEPRAMAREDE